MKNLLLYENKAVVLIRNPLKVILSHWRHTVFGIHSGTEGESMDKYWNLPQNTTFDEELLNSPNFELFAISSIVVWSRTITGK